MPNSSFTLSKPNLAYAKLVATPTETSWSQVYNAGNVFACVSLTIQGETEEDISLPALGKEVIDTLQSEFFILEKKTIQTISGVITKSIEHIKEPVTADVSLGFFKDNILYIFIVGHGRVIMKRQGNIGKLLEGESGRKAVLTASGYLHNDDLVVLETKQFAEDITDATLSSALDLALPNDIAEALSPQMHSKEDGGQAAIIVTYHGISGGIHEEQHPVAAADAEEAPQHVPHTPVDHAPQSGEEFEETEDQEDDTDDYEDDEVGEETEDEEEPRDKKRFNVKLPALPKIGFLSGLRDKMPQPSNAGFKLTHTRKLFLSISIIIVILLVVSIYFTKKKETDTQQQALFAQVYEPALNKYESGQALETLNPDVSYEDYLEAKKLLSENSAKFTPGSEEAKKIQELLAKVEAELAGSSPVQSANAKEATVPENSLLAVAKANASGRGFTQDANNVYFVTNSAIVSVNKSTGAKSDLIKNDDNWEDPVGISTYQSNFYVLDRKKGIVKFVAGGGGYGASQYFKETPNLSTAKDLAIDLSIWVLLQDGTVMKYTSGVSDGFKAPKLEKPISDAAKIFTDPETDNVYILDRGNSRVVRIAKEGSGHSEFVSGVIKNAKDFEVKEQDKKIFILSGDKTYEIAI